MPLLFGNLAVMTRGCLCENLWPWSQWLATMQPHHTFQGNILLNTSHSNLWEISVKLISSISPRLFRHNIYEVCETHSTYSDQSGQPQQANPGCSYIPRDSQIKISVQLYLRHVPVEATWTRKGVCKTPYPETYSWSLKGMMGTDIFRQKSVKCYSVNSQVLSSNTIQDILMTNSKCQNLQRGMTKNKTKKINK